jgi:hypothetical protein
LDVFVAGRDSGEGLPRPVVEISHEHRYFP